MSRGGPVYVSCTGTPAQGRSFAWCRGHPEEWGGGGCRLCGGCKREEQPAASVAGRRRSDAAPGAVHQRWPGLWLQDLCHA